MAASVSIENSSLYGELERGVGVKFLSVMDQAVMDYVYAMDATLSEQGNKPQTLAKMLTTQDQIVHMLAKTGLADPQFFAEGAAIPADSRLIGYKTSVAPQFLGDSVTVTKRAIDDRDYNKELDEAKDISVAMKRKEDKTFFDMLNYGFTAQSSLPSQSYIVGYGDGKPLFSTAHPRLDGGAAQSNASSTGITLTPQNLDTARTALMRQLDDRGNQIDSGSNQLVLLVPSELETTACEIAKSVKKVNTGNNNINVFEGLITVVSSKWLSYSGNGGSLASTAWMLIDPSVAKLCFIRRQGLATHMATDANTLNKTFYATSRFAVAWGDWRGTWASKGDGNSYSG